MQEKELHENHLPGWSQTICGQNDFSVNVFGEKVKFDYAYIVQHGAPGETGQLQGYLEIMNVPFNTCNSFVSAIAFDKYSCKSSIKDSGLVKLAPDCYIRQGLDLKSFCDKVERSLKFPVFVKPTKGGSSFGVTRVTGAEELASAVQYAFSEARPYWWNRACADASSHAQHTSTARR